MSIIEAHEGAVSQASTGTDTPPSSTVNPLSG